MRRVYLQERNGIQLETEVVIAAAIALAAEHEEQSVLLGDRNVAAVATCARSDRLGMDKERI